jgi:glycosyltransferase involved in cell wall biosynthesis
MACLVEGCNMKVSVVMMTYKHENFIAQAVNSVLMQEADFEYELLIGEDCSPDRTREVLITLQQKSPERIRLFLNDVNIKGFNNFNQLLAACRGEYIALLEGDDYWSSPQKLRKQVEFLDAHPDFTICFHNAVRTFEDGSQPDEIYCPENQKVESSLADLLGTNFLPTCSVMFRSGFVKELPEWCRKLPMGDWPLHILNAKHGKIGYLNEVMAVYRVHKGGLWSTTNYLKQLLEYIQLFQAIRPHVGTKYQEMIGIRLEEIFKKVAEDIYQRAIQVRFVKDAVGKANEEIDTWSKTIQITDSWKRKLIGRIYAYFGFASYQDGNFHVTVYCWPRAIMNDISWMGNKGVWSIWLKAWQHKILPR